MGYALSPRLRSEPTAEHRSTYLTAGIMILATVFVAICAHISMPLPWTPVPLVAGDFAVILVGFMLGPQIGFFTMLLYLAEGAAGLPMFSPQGPGGVAQIIGPTGGFLIAYPTIAAVAGAMRSRSNKYTHNFFAALVAMTVLFACGMIYLKLLTGISTSTAWVQAIKPFIPAAIIKCALAAVLASAWRGQVEEAEVKVPRLHADGG